MKRITFWMIFMFVAMASMATDYYIAPASGSKPVGSDSNTGTSTNSPWTIEKGFITAVNPGDHVYIRGGYYGHVHPVVTSSGTAKLPIIFEGYNGTPILDGGDHLGHGIDVIGKQHITLKKIKVKRYAYGIWVINNSHYATIDRCAADSCSDISDVPGSAQEHGSEGYGITIYDSDHSIIKNCSAIDDGGIGIYLARSDYGLIQNDIVKSKQDPRNSNYDKWYITDYYFLFVWCRHTVVRDCYAEDIPASFKGNHGFIVKDTQRSKGSKTIHSSDNHFINCTSNKMEEAFCVSIGAYNNTFDSCYVDNTGKNSDFNFCIEVRDGAHNNTFRNIKCLGKTGCVGFFDRTNEGFGLEEQSNNTFTNCLFQGGEISITMQNAKNNTFKNCNLVNSKYLFRFQGANSTNADDNLGNTLRNCIVSGVSNTYDTRALSSSGWTPNQYNDMSCISATYTDFFNGFVSLPGTGNIAVDPLFADKTNFDFHLKSKYGRWNGTSWVKDAVTSLCINAGDPHDDYSNEPFPNGNRINIGAYGNNAEASKSKYFRGKNN